MLNPLSVLSALACGVIASIVVLAHDPNAATLRGQSLVVEYGPQARDMVQIVESVPFVVPHGKVFVPTALGGDGDSHLAVNGMRILSRGYTCSGLSMWPIPTGLSVQAGSSVETFGPGAKAWGYLTLELTPDKRTQSVWVEYSPHPSDMIQIPNGSTFIVPPGRLFVPTAIGNIYGIQSATGMSVNGHPVLYLASLCDSHVSMASVPIGLAIPAGASVSASSLYSGQVWGYLADQ